MRKDNSMNEIAISVIVPIYNMEKLMWKCLDSILAQTFQDYECLLIDDGSKDGSPAICDEYAASDPRFTAYHKPNGGLSDARNYGLVRAKGEYTIFFDPDDWVDAGYLTDMYAKAVETDADMVICDYYSQDPYQIKYVKQKPASLNHHDVLKDLIVGKLHGFTWNKLLKRDLYSRYNLQYTVGMYGCEDQYTMCALMKNSINITYLPKAYYHYMHYGFNTLSRRYDEQTLYNNILIRDHFYELLKDTTYGNYVYQKKNAYIVTHAFMYGYHYYTSKTFKLTFSNYGDVALKMTTNKLMYTLYYLSLHGLYRPARLFFEVVFDVKQKMKLLKFIIRIRR